MALTQRLTHGLHTHHTRHYVRNTRYRSRLEAVLPEVFESLQVSRSVGRLVGRSAVGWCLFSASICATTDQPHTSEHLEPIQPPPIQSNPIQSNPFPPIRIINPPQHTYRSADSRMTQETLRRHVLRVLRFWRERFLFNDDYLGGLQVRVACNACNVCECAMFLYLHL
jgi:hypothetical protein